MKAKVVFETGYEFVATILMLDKLFEQGVLMFKNDKFMIKSIAQNRSYACSYEIEAAMLKEYDIDSEFAIAVSLDDLKDVLRRHEKKDVQITITVDEYRLYIDIAKRVGGRKKGSTC